MEQKHRIFVIKDSKVVPVFITHEPYCKFTRDKLPISVDTNSGPERIAYGNVKLFGGFLPGFETEEEAMNVLDPDAAYEEMGHS